MTGSAGVVFSGGLLAALLGYSYVMSYDMPDAGAALAVGVPVEGIALLDQNGSPVELAGPGRDVVLVFYRGHW